MKAEIVPQAVAVSKLPRFFVATAAACALLLPAASSLAAGPAPHVQLGTPDDIAIDQPRVQWELHDAQGNLVGPQFDLGGGILDTGANGVLVARDGYLGDDFDYHPDIYQVAKRADGSSVQYSESGVAGSDLFDVFVPYTLAY